MIDWRPIDTAPKDGTRVLIAERDQSGVRSAHLAAWAKYYAPFHRAEIEGWWTSCDPNQAHVTLPEEATHWAPINLPEEKEWNLVTLLRVQLLAQLQTLYTQRGLTDEAALVEAQRTLTRMETITGKFLTTSQQAKDAG